MLREGSEVFSRETMNCGIEFSRIAPKKNHTPQETTRTLRARRFPRLFGDLCAMARDNGRMEEWKNGRLEE